MRYSMIVTRVFSTIYACMTHKRSLVRVQYGPLPFDAPNSLRNQGLGFPFPAKTTTQPNTNRRSLPSNRAAVCAAVRLTPAPLTGGAV